MALSKRLCYSLIILFFVAIVIIIPTVILLRNSGCEEGFVNGAVAADSEICSNIGRDILKQGGSAVDGAIAALLCTSVIHPQSMGLGGGVIFTIYDASTRTVEVINARETVPREFPPNLLEQCATKKFFEPAAQWIGVPGELRGYEAAHKKYGRLPWKALFQPTIRLVTNGVNVSNVLVKYLNVAAKQINDSSLRVLFCKDGKVLKAGNPVNFTQLAHTLQTVADEGIDSFYSGSIAKKMIEDLRRQDSTLTLEDLKNYKAQIVRPLNVSLGNYMLYTPPPPAGGALLSFILNILEASMQNVPDQIETYHHIVEALKFCNGHRSKLTASVTSANIEKFTDTFFSKTYAKEIRNKIDEFGNHDLQFYNLSAPINSETFGTSHLSVISKDGSSVSATSSINHIFGSMIYSPSTGIIFNNQLADFCSIPMVSLKEGMQPPSSMTPTILLSKDKTSQLVIGGSGGFRIISATAQAIVNKLWFGFNIKEAIAAPVFHVQPDNSLNFEPSFNPAIQTGLREKRHNISKALFFLNVVQGIYQEEDCLFPYSDTRKEGKAAGY
ncbi:LOW QUALITY PROTEIN: glutathione hydrolase 5 proenzyme [Bufo bufo]|uniref:LOW QUALITY PROTEIN: glutathione hydrolase 5 proenzyme n=1 Tax=Bufo bufo TaxID=8384 RepID=UPI001ABE7D0A|nr:LOW QUALITY PROTEIN: glutathione hydrolase 5 proenzyme [Bufo bufo]